MAIRRFRLMFLNSGIANEKFLQTLPFLFQVIHCVTENDAPLMHDLNTIAYAFGFVQNMSGKNDAMFRSQFTDKAAYLPYLVGVKSGRGFVENDNIRS